MSGALLRFTVLGCGSSGGVPRVDGDWGACDPGNPKNRRRRSSILVERAEKKTGFETEAVTRVLIDTAPDLREQLLGCGAGRLDAVAYTHDHADQTHGIDDLRALVYRRGERLNAYMSHATCIRLMQRFSYIFETPVNSSYPPLLNAQIIEDDAHVEAPGPGGPIAFSGFTVDHGGAPCSGYRIGPAAYTPDVSGLPAAALDSLAGSRLWIVDALREKPHPSHAHLALTLDWIGRIRPDLALLTNLHVDLDYQSLLERCPQGVRPAYDGLRVTMREADGAIVNVDPA